MNLALSDEQRLPQQNFRRAAELGLTGVALPEACGGAGFDHASYAIVIEEISRVCASTGVILSVQNSLYCDPVYRFGSEEQTRPYRSMADTATAANTPWSACAATRGLPKFTKAPARFSA